MSAINGNVLPYLYQANNSDPGVKTPEQMPVPVKLPSTVVKPETASALQAAQETVQNPNATERRKEENKREAALAKNSSKSAAKNNINKSNIDGEMRLSLIKGRAKYAFNQSDQSGNRILLQA